MELDQDTKDKLLAVIAGKPMQWMLVPDKWSDCSVAQALGWLGLTYMAKSVRIKPEPQVMCELAGAQYPPPMSEALNYGNDYYVASPQGVDQYKWCDDSADDEWLALHICHTTFEAAEAHSKALRAVNAQAVEKAHAGGVK